MQATAVDSAATTAVADAVKHGHGHGHGHNHSHGQPDHHDNHHGCHGLCKHEGSCASNVLRTFVKNFLLASNVRAGEGLAEWPGKQEGACTGGAFVSIPMQRQTSPAVCRRRNCVGVSILMRVFRLLQSNPKALTSMQSLFDEKVRECELIG